MKIVEQRSFLDMEQFRQYTKVAPLLYFHVFDGKPDRAVLNALGDCSDDEALLLLDVAEDQGFLRQTQVTTEVTQDRRFISKPLSELRGLWAWARGTLIDSTEDPAGVERLVEKGRRFALSGGPLMNEQPKPSISELLKNRNRSPVKSGCTL